LSEASLADAKGILKGATDAKAQVEQALREAKNNPRANLPPIEIHQGDPQTAMLMQENVGRQKAHEELEFSQHQVDQNASVIAAQEKKISELTIESTKNDAAIQRLSQRAEKMRELADETRRAADEQERLQSLHETSQTNIDAVTDETTRVKRRNYLQERANSGQLTRDESAEHAGAVAGSVGGAIRETQSQITSIQNNIRLEGGAASADEVAALVQLNDYLVGLLENIHGVTKSQQSNITGLMRRVESLEGHALNTNNYR
jgi:hypothetical protein